jgi:hypothetical protein
MSWWLLAKKDDVVIEIVSRGEREPNFSRKDLLDLAARNPGCLVFNFMIPFMLSEGDVGLRKGRLYIKSTGLDLQCVQYL